MSQIYVIEREIYTEYTKQYIILYINDCKGYIDNYGVRERWTIQRIIHI